MARKTIGLEKVSPDKRVSEIISIFNASNNPKRWDWEYNLLKGEAFFEDKQLTASEIRDLKDADMPTFTVNRITPAILVMEYFLTANKPRWKTIGRDMSGFDSEVGVLHTALSDYCWDLSDGTLIYSQIIHDAIVKSKGVLQIYVDKNSDRGNGDVKFGRIEPEELFVDPESTDVFSRDAKFMIVAKNIGKQKLMSELPQYADIIKNASGNCLGITRRAYWDDTAVESLDFIKTTGEQDEIIGYYECYSKVKIPYITFLQKTPPTKIELDEMQKNSMLALKEFEKEIQVKIKELQKQYSEMVANGQIIPERAEIELEKAQNQLMAQFKEMQSKVNAEITNEVSKTTERTVTEGEYNLLIKDPVIASTIISGSEIKYYQDRIRSEGVVGDKYLWDVIMPYENYTIIPLPFIHTGNPCPISAVKFVTGKQEEINKCHQIVVHHANISSNPGWWYKEGSLVNLVEAKEDISLPGSLIGYVGDNPPVPRAPSQLNNAFYELTQMGKGDISYSLGISDYMMGMERVTNEPFRSTALMDEFGTRRLRTYLQNTVNPWLRQVGKVFKDVAQKTYTAHKIYRIVSSEAGNEKSEYKEYEINKPIFNNVGEIIGKYFDYQSAQFDVVEVADSVWPVSREAKEYKMFEYYQKGAIDKLAFLRSIEIEDKTGIMQRMDEIAQLQQALAQKDEEIKQLRGDADTLRRQVIQSKIQLDTIMGSLQMRKDVLETEAEQHKVRETIKANADIVSNQMLSEADKFRKDIEIIKKSAKQNENK